jgi:hypothetical protein
MWHFSGMLGIGSGLWLAALLDTSISLSVKCSERRMSVLIICFIWFDIYFVRIEICNLKKGATFKVAPSFNNK